MARTKKTKRKKKTGLPKYKEAIRDCTHCILNGRLIAIDPSTGSKSSMPGYAVFENGKLIESGIIEVDLRDNRAKRLYEINRTLREDFPIPDVVAVENIPPRTFRGGSFLNSISLAALQRAVGAITAAWPVNCLVEVPVNAWQRHKPEWYKKSDEHDAIVIGITCIELAKEFRADEEAEVLERKTTRVEV